MKILIRHLLLLYFLSISYSNLNAQETTYVLNYLHVKSKGWCTFKDDLSNPNASICISDFALKDELNTFNDLDNSYANDQKPQQVAALSMQDRNMELKAAKANLIQKDGKYYYTVTKTRNVDSKQKGDADFSEATGKFNYMNARYKATELGDEKMLKTLDNIENVMGETKIFMKRNELGGVNWNWVNSNNLGTKESGAKGGKYKDALRFMIDNDFIDYDQVEEFYEEADLKNEWRDSNGHTEKENANLLSVNKQNMKVNKVIQTKMFKTYITVNNERIIFTVDDKTERTVKFLRQIGDLKIKEDDLGKYEYHEYEGVRYVGTNTNPLSGKFQFGKLKMNNVQYRFLKFHDDEETLFIFK